MGVCLSSTFNFKYNKLDSIADLLLVSIVDDDDRHIIQTILYCQKIMESSSTNVSGGS